MFFKVFITPSSRKSIKRLPREVREEVVRLCYDYISQHPFRGKRLHGPLRECWSFHFKMGNVHYRIAYRIVEGLGRVDVLLVGTRENFYERLRRVLKF